MGEQQCFRERKQQYTGSSFAVKIELPFHAMKPGHRLLFRSTSLRHSRPGGGSHWSPLGGPTHSIENIEVKVIWDEIPPSAQIDCHSERTGAGSRGACGRIFYFDRNEGTPFKPSCGLGEKRSGLTGRHKPNRTPATLRQSQRKHIAAMH